MYIYIFIYLFSCYHVFLFFLNNKADRTKKKTTSEALGVRVAGLRRLDLAAWSSPSARRHEDEALPAAKPLAAAETVITSQRARS